MTSQHHSTLIEKTNITKDTVARYAYDKKWHITVFNSSSKLGHHCFRIITACRLIGTKPLSEPVLVYSDLNHSEQISVKFKSRYETIIGGSRCENIVCKMAAILSRPKCDILHNPYRAIIIIRYMYVYGAVILGPKSVQYDDVIKWKHFPRYWLFVRGIHRSPVNSPHKSQWRGAWRLSLICAWISGWANNREAGDLRRLRAHYDVIVMNHCLGPRRPMLQGHNYWDHIYAFLNNPNSNFN